MKFVADTMLEKLARWLRIIGYDVIFDSSKKLEELVEIANYEERVFLTRRKSFPEEIAPIILYDLVSDNFTDQLRLVIEQFELDYQTRLFSRCTDCNVEVVRVEKADIKDRVPEKSWQGFDEFFECPTCKKVFWKGAHLKNTLNKLKKILESEP